MPQNYLLSTAQTEGATITGTKALDVVCRPRTFEWYDTTGLERQLASLAVTTWVNWTRERREINRLASGLSRAEADQARRYREEQNPTGYTEKLRKIKCEGLSSGHAVSIRTSGMTRWEIGVAGGSLQRLDVHRFAGEIRSAFDSLMLDRDSKIVLLRAEYFDIGVPRDWRTRTERQ